MKRKCILIMTSMAVLLISTQLCSCANNIEKTDDVAVESESEATDFEATETLGNGEAGIQDLSEDQKRMLAIMDSLNMEFYENDDTYAPDDSEYVWRTLYYTIGNNYSMEENAVYGHVEMDEGILTVDKELVMQYAMGLFEGCSSIPELPKDCPVTVNGENDNCYDFPIGERGMSYGAINSWTENSDGTYTVVTELRAADTEEVMATGTYTLVANPNTSDDAKTLFPFSVRAVEFSREM